jgi:hypothetical protein
LYANILFWYSKVKAKGDSRDIMKLRLTAIVASIAVLLLPLFTVTTGAQSASSQTTTVESNSNSLRVAPVRTDLEMDPGTTKELTVYLQNLSPQTVQARAIISDFVASTDETGKPNVILEEDRYAPSHSLKRLAITEPNLLSLGPNTRAPVKVRITVPKNAKAGGYYGAVRYIPAADLSTGDSTGVAISTNLGSLILLKVTGDLEEKLTLATFDVRQKGKPGTFFQTPDDLKVRLRVKNEGNVQVQPFGKIRVLDRNNKAIEEYEVNNVDPRGNVLPDTIRRFEQDLKKVGSFGKYTVEATVGYGSGGELITTKLSFWVVPMSVIIGGISALIILILLIIFIPKMIRAYNRKIVSRAGRRY